MQASFCFCFLECVVPADSLCCGLLLEMNVLQQRLSCERKPVVVQDCTCLGAGLILGLTLGGHCWHKPKSYPLTYTFSAINLTFKSLHDILSLKCQEGKMSVTLWVLHNKDYCRLFQRKHETETKFLSNFRFYLNHGNSIENGQCLITRQYINICLAYLKGLLS